jgi:predicted amidohydrolase YtcJ
VTSGFGDDWVKFAGIKIFYDGGMTLKTALMRDVSRTTWGREVAETPLLGRHGS